MKNYLIGFCFLVGAFFLIWKQSEQQIERTNETNTTRPLEAEDSNLSFALAEFNNSMTQKPFTVGNAGDVLLKENLKQPEDLFHEFSNNFSSLTFTSHLGSIRNIHLHQHDRLNKSYNMPVR